jgi:hypothetical protein
MEKTAPMAAEVNPTEQADPAESGPLRRPDGPLWTRHDCTRQLARRNSSLRRTLSRAEDLASRPELLGMRPDLLRGVRGFKYPYIALTSENLAKPWRHILSQKVIAGTMTVHPPYVRKPSA